MEIVTWDPNNERTYKQRTYSCLETITLEFYRDGEYCSQCPQGNWSIQHKDNFSSALLNEIPPTSQYPKERRSFSVLEAASHAAVSRSPHTTHLSFTSNLFSQWQKNHRNQSQVWLWKFFQRILSLKVKTRNLRFHNKRQTKWMWFLADAKCVMMGFGTTCHCGEISESRARTN